MKRGGLPESQNEHREISKAALDRDIKLAGGLLEHHLWKAVEIVKDGSGFGSLPNDGNGAQFARLAKAMPCNARVAFCFLSDRKNLDSG
jgi:hypothetical protein